MKELYDGKGNVLQWDGGNIYLRLHGRKGRRNIGWWEPGTSSYHTERKDVHTFRAVQGWAFNWHLLKNAKFSNIVVHHNGKKYEADVATVMRDGTVVQFSRKGFELQVVYPFALFKEVA